MADLVVTAAQVSLIDPHASEIHPGLPEAALTAGTSVYLKSTGKFAASNAGASGTTKTAGLALETAGTRQGVSILKRGKVAGFAVSGLAYGALVYLSDTAGKLADAAGTVSVVIGKVVPLSDSDITKVLYIDANWLT